MMAVVRRTLNRWWVFWPALGLHLAMGALPARVWFDSHSIAVSDATVGSAPTVVEDRTIRFSFLGEYTATTRDVLTNEVSGGCAGSGRVRYRGGLSGVKTMSLVDWTDGKVACASLAPGTYYTETCRTVLYPLWGILPRKTTCATSNIFTVRASNEAG